MNLISTVPLADTWGMHGDFGGAWMIVMMGGMALFWGAIILGIVWLARGGFEGRRERRTDTPTDVLERRFAEGAISVDDYRARREVLVNGNAKPNGDHEDEPLTAPLAREGRQS
jgi:putative membrane protein